MAVSSRRSRVFSRIGVALIVALAAGWLVSSASTGRNSAMGRCAAAKVRAALNDFSYAFNQGDAVQLDALFAREPDFKWYSSGRPGERFGEAADRRDTLLGYFLDRHRAKDRLFVRSFRFQGNSAGVGHFHGTFWRSAADFRSGEPFKVVMKGATLCRGGKRTFVVLSIGGPR